MLKVHHLSVAQSERIVWLCEELGIEYELVRHIRRPESQLAPDSLTNLSGNISGTAPFLEDGDVKLGESEAIAEYILTKYGNGKLVVPPGQENYPAYLFWFHFANATLQPAGMGSIMKALGGLPDDGFLGPFLQRRFEKVRQNLDNRLKEAKWLAGNEFTAADCMTLYSLSTQRYFGPADLSAYPNLLRWMKDCGERPAYQRAMKKGDPDMEPALDAKGPQQSRLGG